MNVKFNPERPDEDNPEWTKEDFKKALTFSELPTELQETLRRVRGPQKKPTKIPATIRFDADLLTALRATGRGWQTRVNDALRDLVARNAI